MKKGLLTKIIFLAIGLVLIASIMAMACGTSTPATSTTKPATTTTSKPATTTAAIKKGGTLRFGINQDYPTLGMPATQQYASGYPISDIVLESLFVLDASGTPQPWLATGYSFDSTGTKLTLTLRKGVKFSDGTDFDAAAVQWNLNQCIALKKTEVASVKSVDVVDPSTVVLNLSQPDGILVTYLGSMRGNMMSPTSYQNAPGATDKDKTAYCEAHPVGTGPFVLNTWTHDVSITFDKNPNYWQAGKPYLDHIVFTIITNETTEMASFQAGELDVIYTQQMQNIRALDDTGKYNLLKGDVSLLGSLEGDSANPDSPFANILVRQAAAYSIDNAAFAKAMGYGYWVATNQFDIPGRWGYNPNVVGYPYNVDKGKQLMAQAGYPNGFTTNIYGMTHYETMLASLQDYLSKVGINVNAQIVTPADRVNMFSTAGWKGLWLWECTGVPSSLMQMGRNFTAAAAPTRLHSVNVPADFSAEVSQAMTATDFKTQQQDTWQIQKDMVDKYAFLTFIYGEYTPLPTYRST